MAKQNQSHMVTISNVWGVDEYQSQYGVRFRNDTSSTGWAKAFIPKNSNVHVNEGPFQRRMKTFVVHESVGVKVRFHDDETHYHTEDMNIRDFKVLYNESRELVKADKAKAAQEQAEQIPARELPDTPDQMDHTAIFDDVLPFE